MSRSLWEIYDLLSLTSQLESKRLTFSKVIYIFILEFPFGDKMARGQHWRWSSRKNDMKCKLQKIQILNKTISFAFLFNFFPHEILLSFITFFPPYKPFRKYLKKNLKLISKSPLLKLYSQTTLSSDIMILLFKQ